MAIVERNFVRDMTTPYRDGDVVLGDDWVAPDKTATDELRSKRARRGLFSLRASPLTRKIITFNLIALNVLAAGILYLNSSRDSLAVQRGASLVSEAELIADVFEAQLATAGTPDSLSDAIDVDASLGRLDLRSGIEVFVFDSTESLVAQNAGAAARNNVGAEDDTALISDGLSWLWGLLSRPFESAATADPAPLAEQLQPLVSGALVGGTKVRNDLVGTGGTLFSVATPIVQNGLPVGVVAVTSAAGEIDKLVRGERERVLQMFVIATLVSIGLSLVLASTIANPLSDLAAAAARSDNGFAMVEASTRLNPIETSVAITNIWSTLSRSPRTSLSISPAAEVTATTPTGNPFCTIGVATEKSVPPVPTRSFRTLVPPTNAPETNGCNCSANGAGSAVAALSNGRESSPQSQLNPSEISAVSSSAPTLFRAAAPAFCATRLSVESNTNTSIPLRKSSRPRLASTSIASLRLSGVPAVANCASKTSAISSASETSDAPRCTARLSREELR